MFSSRTVRLNSRQIFALFREQRSSFGGWCAKERDKDPFLQIDFVRDAVITGMATQGLAFPKGNWVTKYALNYSCDGKFWRSYEVRGKQAVSNNTNLHQVPFSFEDTLMVFIAAIFISRLLIIKCQSDVTKITFLK